MFSEVPVAPADAEHVTFYSGLQINLNPMESQSPNLG